MEKLEQRGPIEVQLGTVLESFASRLAKIEESISQGSKQVVKDAAKRGPKRGSKITRQGVTYYLHPDASYRTYKPAVSVGIDDLEETTPAERRLNEQMERGRNDFLRGVTGGNKQEETQPLPPVQTPPPLPSACKAEERRVRQQTVPQTSNDILLDVFSVGPVNLSWLQRFTSKKGNLCYRGNAGNVYARGSDGKCYVALATWTEADTSREDVAAVFGL